MKLCKECEKEFYYYMRELLLDVNVHLSFSDEQIKRIHQLMSKHFKIEKVQMK